MPSVLPRAAVSLDEDACDALVHRITQRFEDAYRALDAVFGVHRLVDDVDELVGRLLEHVVDAAAARPPGLRRLDHRREIDPGWYLDERMIGYVCYADRFAGDLHGVRRELDYLADLGVTYLHLMPLLASRRPPNDGGYAVVDFGAVDQRLGSMDDLEALAGDLRQRGMSLCVDVVVNHTAREHPWALAAMAGDARARAMYLTFPDRTGPDRFEATLPDVFPHTAPGSFTWVPELDRWVWTTFHDYQWDLDHRNPDVFTAILDVIATLGNRGVEVLRLDAVPFLWKREGTDCQNQPEVHHLVRAWRALTAMAMPAVIFKAEAIVPSEQLVRYLGTAGGATDPEERECELAYHNQLMVQSWSGVATRDALLARHALARMAAPPAHATWVTYVRCHDDIGWAIGDDDARAVGWNGHVHRRFLSDYFAGEFPLSFARGARFQDDPRTGSVRTSGMTATLCGIEEALDAGADPAALDDLGDKPPDHPDVRLDLGIRRLLLLYAVAYGYGGIPLVWMGDELALRDDRGFADDREHAADNRWLHRPRMDREAAARRHDARTLEGRVFAALRHLGQVRASTPALRSGATITCPEVDDPRVLAWARRHARGGRLLGLVNVADEPASAPAALLDRAGVREAVDLLDPTTASPVRDWRIALAPLQVRWLVAPPR